jgi:HlyD family secretion protein
MLDSELLPGEGNQTVRTSWKKWIGWLVVLGLIAGGVFFFLKWRAANKPPDVVYKTAPVERRKITGRVTASGTLSAVVTVSVGSQVSGRIAELNADFNSTVKKGQVIARIDPQLLLAAQAQTRANYLAAQANVQKAKIEASNAEKILNRTRKLQAEQLASQADLDAAETALASAQADIAVANASVAQVQAQLNQAEVNLSFTTIKSPIDGTVISRAVDVGQTVAASLQAPVLFTIAEDLRKMQVATNVSEGDVGRLQPDMDTWFTVDAFPGQRFRGTVLQIRNAAQTVQNVVTYNAVIDVPNPDLKLRPGMTANVTIVYAQRENALAVPNTALRYRPIDAAPSAKRGENGGPAGSSSGRRGGRRGPASAPTEADGGAPLPTVMPLEDKTIYLLRGGVPTPVTIHTGLSDGTITEVVDGDVKQGDEVIVEAVSSGAPTTSATGAAGGAARSMRL